MQAMEEMLAELDADPVWGPGGQQPKQEPRVAEESGVNPWASISSNNDAMDGA